MTDRFCHFGGKVIYESYSDAEKHRRIIASTYKHRKKKSQKNLFIYECPYCNKWHLTKKRQGIGKVRE